MSLSYDNIPLGLLHTRRYTAEEQMSDDGLDYLDTKYTLEVDFVWHERATASNMVNGVGDRAGVSIANLQQRLSQPRRPLVYRIGSDIVLSSPLPNPLQEGNPYPCDTRGGPFPRVMSLTAVNGGKSAFGSFRVETFLNECECPDSYALSHRWSDSQSMDGPPWYVHRKVRGRIIFRLDKLISANFSPDSFRQWFLHPIPNRYRRENLVIWVSEDGSQLQYEFEDIQQALNLVPNAGIADVGGFSRGGFAFWKSGNPLATTRARVEVWGYPHTPKTTLANAAILIAKDRVVVAGNSFNVMASSMQFDIKEPIVTFEMDVLQNNTLVLQLRDAPFLYNWMMNTADVIPHVLTNGQFDVNPAPYRADGRPTPTVVTDGFGATIGALCAQALSAPCQVPNKGWYNDNDGSIDVNASGVVY